MMYSLTKWHALFRGELPNFQNSLSRPITSEEKALGYDAGLYLYGAYIMQDLRGSGTVILRTLRASVKNAYYPGDPSTWLWRDANTGERVEPPASWAYTGLGLMEPGDVDDIGGSIKSLQGFMEKGGAACLT